MMATQPPSRGPRVKGGRPTQRPVSATAVGATPLKTAPKYKRILWTTAFAAVAMVGSIYGAGLKTQREFKTEKQHIIESTAEERIQFLENRRTLLTNSKMPLERKLKNLHERMRLQEAEAKAKAEPEQSQ